MLFWLPNYEVKYNHKKTWEKISETKVLGKIQETYGQVTPAIQEMMDGKQIPTPNAVLRIRGFNEVPFE